MTLADTARRGITVDDLLRVKRLADAQISPDGASVAYVVTEVNIAENSSRSTIWLVPTAGGAARQLTTTDKKDRHPRWSPDGKQILFESNRSGSQQLWLIDVSGGEARQMTTISTEAGGGIWSPDGQQIAFTSAIFAEFSEKPFAESDAANKKRLDEVANSPVKARVFDRLFFRHWDSWVEGKRQHLFVMPAGGGEPRDVTPGDADAAPTSTTFSVEPDYSFTPDGQALVFTAPPRKDEAWSTNYDIYRVKLDGGKPENLTAANDAADGCPRFSPDGKWLAYRAQRRTGYEADRWELTVSAAGGGKPRSITPQFDASVDDFVWSSDSRMLYFLSEQQGRVALFKVPLEGGEPQRVAADGSFTGLTISGNGKLLASMRSSMQAPPEVVAISPDGKVQTLTQSNAALLSELDLPAPESVTVSGAGGTPMQMWILKPPGFKADQKWPLVYLVHGGPQGAWGDSWSYRWNPQVWAAQGYVVAMPNPRGSTGFGQQYVDEISGDWGGRCFEDLMAGVTYLEKQPYVDRDRMAAAGASFGGYMMNWFEGHTDKFKTLITHCGVYNFDSVYATTEELWFDEWEHGGPPWGGKRDSYEKHSPHRFAQNFRTPMLIIHNDQDFRVPVGEGFQMFTTLQRLGVPSKMINFPDEGHWVLKPANSQFWHNEIFGWLERYVPPGGRPK